MKSNELTVPITLNFDSEKVIGFAVFNKDRLPTHYDWQMHLACVVKDDIYTLTSIGVFPIDE